MLNKLLQPIAAHIRKNPALIAWIKRSLGYVGFDATHWIRVVMYRECFRLIEDLNPCKLDALEVSSGIMWQQTKFKSYSTMNFPDYDICTDVLDQQFDLIIADNVFEHLPYPYRAAKNVYSMLRPGGKFLIVTPFLVRIHDVPVDCSRWTELGMSYFLEECGFDRETMITGSWGNRSCVKANLKTWARRGWFGSLSNEKDFPVQVWALAEKPGCKLT